MKVERIMLTDFDRGYFLGPEIRSMMIIFRDLIHVILIRKDGNFVPFGDRLNSCCRDHTVTRKLPKSSR